MKLAEALLERKSLLEKIRALQARLEENAVVQEGDAPAEAPQGLMAELDAAVEALEELIRRINVTNLQTTIASGLTITAAVVKRDMLKLRRETLQKLAEAAAMRYNRYSRSEVKYIATVNNAEVRQQIDSLAKSWRELDAEIQAANWIADLAA